jgi:asparagine synthase (glutamine-hydrolysing)
MGKIERFSIMCGIAGIINFQSPINEHKEIVSKFHTDLHHRGPDAKGYYFSPSSNALLCQTRLSIIDTSDNANQPIESYDKRFNIIFNGEIYNYKELNKIIYKRFNIHTKSDTEVLLYMYIEYGAECLKYIRGMFSFAIWDNLKEEIFIARDSLGIKPLYYNFSNNKLSFCSELRSLMKSKQFDCKLNYQAINSYLLTGYFHEPDTIIENISVLESGHYIILNKESFSKINYSENDDVKNHKKFNRQETLDAVKNGFKKSVEHHLESDVSTGVFLSGGIDSSAILSVASQFSKVTTLSLGFEEKKWDESRVSKKIAQYYKSNHHEHIVKEQEAVDAIDDFIDTIDQPTVDGFNTYFISRFTKQTGLKVVLSGLGGDELFGGYPSFRRMKIINHYLTIKNNLFSKEGLKKITPNTLIEKRNPRLVDLIHSDNLLDSYIALRGIFSKKQALSITTKLSENDSVNFANKTGYINKNSNIDSTTRNLELSNYLKNQLLRDSDIFGMKWSTEIRTPFVDKNFISLIKSLPEKYIFEKNKRILSESLNLPMHIINQKKQGFVLPFEIWLKNTLGKEISIKTSSLISNDSEWYKIWTVFILQKWIDKNI